MNKHYANINLKTYIYWGYGFLMGLFKPVRVTKHRHYSVEIYIGLDGPFKIDMGYGWNEHRAVIIDSNRLHQVREVNGWVALLLMDPTIEIINELRKNVLNGRKYVEIDRNIINPFIKKLHKFKEHAYTCHDAKVLLNELINSISKNNKSYFLIDPRIDLDPRIQKTLKIFKDIPVKKISVHELSQLINLSESRLAHLFKEQIGIPIRRFLLWLRLKEALRLIVNGESFTTAAYESGFSDLAHLSRTYRKMFGLSLTIAFKLRKFIHIVTEF